MRSPNRPYEDRVTTNAAFAAHVSRGKVDFYERAGVAVVMGERAGATFCDAFDPSRKFFNCHSNGGVFNLGHRHADVIAAVRNALDSLDIGNHHFVSGQRAKLAERLAASTGGELPGVVFGVSGGEAVDLALKLARGVTGRAKIVSARGGYHGHTGLALAAGDAEYREPFGVAWPEFVQVPFNDADAMERAVDGDTAAVILETIPATLGMPLPAPGYLKRVREFCTARGARLVLDEVQTGLGRTGTMWAWQGEDVVPDAMVTGKGLSGGVYPITATLLSAEMHRFFDARPFVHISTFGGAEVGCAAAIAVLDVVERIGFLERVLAVGERFEREFAGLPFVVRRRGMFMGLAFPFEGGGMVATKALFDAGIFAVYANHDTSVLQFLPPLVVRDDDVDGIVSIVRKVFG